MAGRLLPRKPSAMLVAWEKEAGWALSTGGICMGQADLGMAKGKGTLMGERSGPSWRWQETEGHSKDMRGYGRAEGQVRGRLLVWLLIRLSMPEASRQHGERSGHL